MYFIIPGIILFLAAVIFSRLQNEKGLKLLTNEQRGALVQSYAKTRVMSMLILSGIIIGFLVLSYLVKIDKMIALVAYLIAILIYFGVTGFSALQKMKTLNLPEAYMEHTRRATWIRIAGLSCFIILMGIGMYQEFLHPSHP